MAERVDPTPEIHQPTAFPPAPHTLDTDAGVEQLPPSDYPMLRLGQGADETNGMFVFHDDT